MSSSRRLTALLATAGAACALGVPAASQAAPIYEVTYDVGFEATIDYEHIYKVGDEFDSTEVNQSAPIRVHGTVDTVTFRNGRLLNARPWGLAEYEATGGGATKIHDWYNVVDDRMERDTSACTTGSGVYAGQIILDDDPDAPPVAGGGEAMQVRFGEMVQAFFNCTGEAGGLDGVSLANPYEQMPLGDGILDGDFELPAEAIGMGTIIQHINAPVAHRSPQYCPGQGGHSISCTYNWQGKLTFTKTEEHQYGIEDLPPGYEQPQQGQQQTQQPQQPAGDDDDLIVPLVPVAPKTAKLVGNRLTFPVTCPAGCLGVAKVGAVKQKFSVAKTAKKVTLKLPAKARKALKKASKPKVKLTLTPKGGGAPVRATVRVKRA